jgi:hypothetical protein
MMSAQTLHSIEREELHCSMILGVASVGSQNGLLGVRVSLLIPQQWRSR